MLSTEATQPLPHDPDASQWPIVLGHGESSRSGRPPKRQLQYTGDTKGAIHRALEQLQGLESTSVAINKKGASLLLEVAESHGHRWEVWRRALIMMWLHKLAA